MTPQPDAAPAGERCLVVKMSSLGDLFHALPAVHLLKTSLNCTFDWVVQPEFADIVSCFTDVERVLVFPRKGWWRNGGAFRKSLREERYDRVFDFQGLMKSALAGRMARAKRRYGFQNAREGAGLFYDERVPSGGPEPRHAVDVCLDMARHLGAGEEPVRFPVRFPAADLAGEGLKVGLAPCSRWPGKDWSPEQFAELGRALQEIGATLYLLGAPKDRPVCEGIGKQVGDAVHNLAGQTGLVELGGVLQQLDLLVTVDSGPMHIAAALQTPVLALFGATDPARTGPYGAMHRVILSETFRDDPQLARSFKHHDAGAWHIPTEQVVREAMQLLMRRK